MDQYCSVEVTAWLTAAVTHAPRLLITVEGNISFITSTNLTQWLPEYFLIGAGRSPDRGCHFELI